MDSTFSLNRKTNKEVLDFIKENENTSQKEMFNAAIVFFGSFSGGKKKLDGDISRLKAENKSRKRKAHKNLMKDCGGGGKEGNIPPAEYMPECFDSDKMCFICNLDFNTNENLREHAKMVHKEHVKKCWSNDAMANILLYHEYKNWLETLKLRVHML